MGKILLVSLLFVVGMTLHAASEPSFENPRKMIVQIGTESEQKINHILSSINNIMKEYPTGTLEVAVVAYYHGLSVLKKQDNPFKKRIEALQQYDVEFIACGNTMVSKKWDKSMLIEDLTYVKAGLAEVMERVVDGWVNIRP